MKLLISSLILLISSGSLNAQTDCEKLLIEKINLQEKDFEKIQLELVTNFSKLKDCGWMKLISFS